MYRFALRPRWILSHLFVLALVVLMVNLGFWQLRRLDQRKAFNATVRSALVRDPAPLAAGATPAAWDRVVVRGTFRAGAEVLVANRAKNGTPGYWLLSPLDTANGTIAVSRGFIARALVAQGALTGMAVPAGEVELVGIVQTSRGGAFATTTSDAGVQEISQVDVPDLAAHWQTDLLPFWLQSTAAENRYVEPQGEPVLDNGPHLGYAVQWFVFSLIAIVGYPLILRRNAIARRDGTDDEPEDDPRRDAPTTGDEVGAEAALVAEPIARPAGVED